MAVPVIFPMQTVPATDVGIQNLAIDAYIKGTKTPNAIGALAEGVTAGINQYQTVRENEAKIELTQAEVVKARAAAQLAPLQIHTEALNAQTAAIRAQTEAQLAPQRAAIELMSAQTNAKRVEYEASTAQIEQQTKQQALNEKIGANKAITALQQGDITTAVLIGEQNQAALIGGAFDEKNPIAAGQRQAIESFPRVAREAVARGQASPEIIQRADRIFANYQRQSDVATAKERKEYAPPPPGAPLQRTDQQTNQPLDVLPSEEVGAAQQRLTSSASTQQTQTIQPRSILPSASATTGPQLSPTQEGGGLPTPPTVFTPGPTQTDSRVADNQSSQTGALPAAPKEAPNTSVNSLEFRNKRLKSLTDELFQQSLAVFPDQRNLTVSDKSGLYKQAQEQALKILDSTSLSPAENKELAAIQNTALGFDRIKVRADTAMTHLDEWIKDNGDPSLGPTATWANLEQAATAKLGFPGFRAKYDKLIAIKKEISDVASAAGVIANAELGGTGRTIDSDAERRGMQGMYISPDSSLLQIRSGYNLLKAKAQENADVSTIIKGLLDQGETYSTAVRKAFIYQDTNKGYVFDPNQRIPAELTGTGKDEAIPIENPKRITGEQYLQQLFSGTVDGNGGGQSSRVTGAATTPTDGYSLLGTNLHTADGELNKAALVETVQNVNPRQIPNTLKQANEFLVHSLINIESGGDPNAKNPESSAKGLMQLIDGTGQRMWKTLGFDKTLGEYDPFNPHANVVMGTKYLNQQLDRFNGDTRLAVAAYKRGPEQIGKIYDALSATGTTPTWDQVKTFLPKEAQKDAISYVRKVMGDDRLDASPKMPPGMTYADAVNTLPEGPAQQHAQINLTPRAKEDFASTITATKLAQVQGSPFGDFAKAILDMVSPDAEAQNSATATPAQSQAEALTEPEQYTQVDPSKSYAFEALVMGVARTATFGGDITAAAHLTSLWTGEPYEQTYQRLRGIEDALYEKYPRYYLGGEAVGVVAPGLAGAVARKVIPGTMAQVFGKEATTAVARTAGETISRNAKIGAAAGGAQGFLETHPNPESTFGEAVGERLVGGATGGVIGGVVGSAVGAGVVGANSALKSKTITGPITAGITQVKGERIPPKVRLTAGEREVSNRITGLTTPELETELTAELTGKNPNRVFGSTVPGVGNIEQAVKAQATVPEVSEGLQRVSTKYFDNRNTVVREAVRDVIPEFAIADAAGTTPSQDLVASLESKLAGRNERIGEKLGVQTSTKALPTVAEDAHRGFAKLTVAKEAQLEAQRSTEAAPLYKKAAADLPDLRTQPKAKVVFQLEAQTGPRTTPVNLPGQDKTFRSGGQLYKELQNIPDRVPGIADPAFIDLVKRDPVIADAVSTAQRQVGGGVLPANSIEVLKQAKRNLAREASQPAGYAAGNAFAKLRDAMGNPKLGGSNALREADRVYFEGSRKISGFATPLVQKIQKFAEIGQEADVSQLPKRLLGMDKSTIKQFLDHFTPEEQNTIKDSVLSHLHDQFAGQGEKITGKLQSFPDLNKPQLVGRLETILGEAETKQLLADVASEQKLHTTLGELHASKDPGGYLLAQPITKLKTVLKNLDPEQLSNAKAAIGEHVMNKLENQKEVAPGQALSFPEFLSKQGREKLKIILGEDAGNTLADRFKEETQTAALMRGIRQHGSSTAPTLAEQQRQKAALITRGVHAVLSPWVKELYGIPSAQLDMAAIFRSFPAGRKAAQEVADILVNNPEMRVSFLKKEIANRLRAEKQTELIKPFHQAIDFIVSEGLGQTVRGAAQATVSGQRMRKDELYNATYLQSRDNKKKEIEKK